MLLDYVLIQVFALQTLLIVQMVVALQTYSDVMVRMTVVMEVTKMKQFAS